MTHLDIHLVVDESGSMTPRHAWLVKAYNDFFAQQKTLQIEGQTCSVSTYFFNDVLRRHLQEVPIADVPELMGTDYRPGSGTALYDSMIAVLEEIGTSSTDTHQKLLVVLTDGMNNSGLKSASDLQQKMEEIRVEVVYMGSNQDAILHGSRVGARMGATLQYTDDHMLDAMDSIGNAVTRMRSGETEGIEFTSLEREVSSGGGGGGAQAHAMPSYDGRSDSMLQLPLLPVQRYDATYRGSRMESSLDSLDSDTETVV